MSYDELRAYIDYLRDKKEIFDVRIDWSVINSDKIASLSHGKRCGLVIADAIAGSFFKAVELNSYGFTEDHYAKILTPIVYKRRGIFRGYGIKFWPKEMEAMLNSGRNDRFRWVFDYYTK